MQSVEEIRARVAEVPTYDRSPVDGPLRALDVVIAAGGMLLLFPVLVLVGVAILLTSGQPLLYRGLRVGRDGRFFEMYKFRTLAPDAESRLGPYYGAELSARTVTELTKLVSLAGNTAPTRERISSLTPSATSTVNWARSSS